MAKRKKGKVIQMLSPENYIKQNARKLPIHECWVNSGWKNGGLASVIVSRKHTNGNFTFGLFLVDLKCLGVKDAQYFFNASPTEYKDIVDESRNNFEIEQVSYTLGHNIIFAGLEFADDYGFKPHKDFSVAQYILEEDTDDIELLEIECGYNGKPMYVRGPHDTDAEVNRILMQLEKTAGLGNFDFVDDPFAEAFPDEEWDDEEWDDVWEDEEELTFDGELHFNEEEVADSSTFQFRVQIDEISNPTVWRTVTVPSYYSFYHFHFVIQAAFGWTNSHLFQFSPKGFGSGPCIKELFDDDLDFEYEDPQDAKTIKLSEIFSKKGQKYTYIYDFGDDWTHKITLEKILPKISGFPTCIAGEGKCPPEDCGGVHGFENMKRVLTDKNDEEYREYVEWLGLKPGEIWDSEEFDVVETNRMLLECFATK